jgi:CxxC motif-containing protein (DUF1111 family)
MKTRAPWFTFRRIFLVTFAVAPVIIGFAMLRHSPSVRASATVLGDPIPNLTALETTLFNSGSTPFNKIWAPKQGLGPVFTQKDCNLCHASPVPGGGSPGTTKKDTLFGTVNSDGSFNPLTSEGGILLQNRSVASFIPGCVLSGEVIPADATLIDKRLAPQAYGMGLIDSIPASVIQAQAVNQGMGIQGQTNQVLDQNGNTTVGKFGYKAEDATLVQFVADAMTNEIGITNPISQSEQLPQGQPIPPNCNVASEPNDDGTQMIGIFHFLLYLAPNPAQSCTSTSCMNGQALFNSIGCALCHLPPTMMCSGAPCYTTGPNIVVPKTWQGSTFISNALSNQLVPLYSDLLLHNMGSGLGDGFPFWTASGNQFRTTPLWGLSTRTGYLHDGRVTDLTQAIQWHCANPKQVCDSSSTSEAMQVIQNFNALSLSDQTDLITFINTL